MQSVGQQIREQRLRLGLKLEEISAKSRISLKVLQAIESDDLAAVSSPFLYRSFARQFAAHLKLDLGPLNTAVDEAAKSMPQPRIPGQGQIERAKLAPLPVRGRKGNFRWLYSVASLGFMLVACSSVYSVWQNSKSAWLNDLGSLRDKATRDRFNASSGASKPQAVVESWPATRSGGAQRPEEHATPRSTPPPPDKPAAQEETLASGGTDSSSGSTASDFRIELSALERTWLSVVEDGKQTFSGILAPEETKVLEGHETARIRTGNAGGLNCVFNGRPIGPLGPRGQVRTVVFTKSNYEVLGTPAPPIALLTRYPSIGE